MQYHKKMWYNMTNIDYASRKPNPTKIVLTAWCPADCPVLTGPLQHAPLSASSLQNIILKKIGITFLNLVLPKFIIKKNLATRAAQKFYTRLLEMLKILNI